MSAGSIERAAAASSHQGDISANALVGFRCGQGLEMVEEITMNKEPSDIIRLLGELSQEHTDWTCKNLHDYAVYRNEPILNVCFEAIQALVREKAHLKKVAMDTISCNPKLALFVQK